VFAQVPGLFLGIGDLSRPISGAGVETVRTVGTMITGGGDASFSTFVSATIDASANTE
jgi:hypothetical protein